MKVSVLVQWGLSRALRFCCKNDYHAFRAFSYISHLTLHLMPERKGQGQYGRSTDRCPPVRTNCLFLRHVDRFAGMRG